MGIAISPAFSGNIEYSVYSGFLQYRLDKLTLELSYLSLSSYPLPQLIEER